MAIESRFRHTLVIQRLTPGDDTTARGNRVDTYEDQDPISGLVERRKPREIRGSEPDLVGVSDADGFVSIGTVVDVRDRIVADGLTYEVVGPPVDAGGRGRHLELELLLVVP